MTVSKNQVPALFQADQLTITIKEKKVLEHFSLQIFQGELHALMGKNGSGKTSLATALLGHPQYKILSGALSFEGTDLLPLAPEKRAQKGIFLAFQNPIAIPGVSLVHVLRASMRTRFQNQLSAKIIRSRIEQACHQLHIPQSFLLRAIHDGFSGGEKKRIEMLQLLLLEPKLAILDETDSGLDSDAIKLVSSIIQSLHKKGTAFLVITHYQKLLETLRPSHIHILSEGHILKSGSLKLAQMIEQNGYEWVQKKGGVCS